MKIPEKIKKFKAAFTMVELLVVIVIIAVLATLLFSLTNRLRNKASSAISASNLRQIGTMIMTYATDNNSILPGPTLTDNFPRYQNNSASGQLAWHLKDYFEGVPQPQNPQPRMFYSPVFDYPAARTGAQNPTSQSKPSYVIFCKISDVTTRSTIWPLGNYNNNSSGDKTPAMTTLQLAARDTRGLPWITEIDQVIRPSTSRYGSPEKPAHGNFRNTLMFDFSVKAIPVSEFD